MPVIGRVRLIPEAFAKTLAKECGPGAHPSDQKKKKPPPPPILGFTTFANFDPKR